ncbi:MAG: metallophosphoesterase [Muribaculaceae bacterium]|nr:metallophosphoesterase [Muribaculaceae bacterium]MBQ3910019.1 metallophosphoesterase [Muribaculaceae bacterium]
MKHIMITAWCLLMAMAAPRINARTMQGNNSYRIMVISDTHLLAPSLHDDGKAARQLDNGDMKMVLESDIIVSALVGEIIKAKPQLLLISGDLTFNGERASHERLVEHLRRLEQAGVRTLVIPGNHDVMCPYSKQYTGDEPMAVPSVTSEEFASIYASCGYGADSQRDPASLSYSCEPIPGLVVLGIDSNIYSSSTDSNVTYHTNGAVRPETLEWIRQQLAVARAGGKRVIAMMHHHLVEHIDGEAQLLPNYIVARRNDVAQVLREGGVKVVFTGHLHITDAATQDGITDVSTGSASTYPIAMRTATIDPSLTAMSIETKILENLGSCSLDKGRSKIENSAPVLAGIVSRRLWSRMEPRLKQYEPLLAEQGVDTSRLPRKAGDVAALITRHLSQPLAQSLMMVARGGEDPAQAPAIVEAVKQGVRGMVADVFTEGADDVADFLIENLMPRAQVLMRSALEDINQVGTSEQSTTHDHSLTVKL